MPIRKCVVATSTTSPPSGCAAYRDAAAEACYGDHGEALKVVWRGLGSVDGLPELGLPGIGGLFDTGALDFLMDCSLSNQALQSAVYSLSLVKEPRSQAMRIVDYRNLGAEELGSIYESLLELMPSWDPATKTCALVVSSGNQRKDTGSYYTPPRSWSPCWTPRSTPS